MQKKIRERLLVIYLLMEQMCEMPDKQFMSEVMTKHLGESECFCYDKKMAGFAPSKYKVHFEKDNRDIPPQLMIMGYVKTEKPVMDEIAESQLWDCTDGAEILDKCKYRVFAADMLAAGLNYKERAEMLVESMWRRLSSYTRHVKRLYLKTQKKCLQGKKY